MNHVVMTFGRAVAELEERFSQEQFRLADVNVEAQLHEWLDGDDEPLPWSDPGSVSPDECFFVTTLYGQMTLAGQRTHVGSSFEPLFVRSAQRDVRNFIPGLHEYAGLCAAWMAPRLWTMGQILRSRRIGMDQYVRWLGDLDRLATPEDPMPALDAIVRDHQVTGWKTLSVFVRDCVVGNCFPIDSRVTKELDRWGLRLPQKTSDCLCASACSSGVIRDCWRGCSTKLPGSDTR